MQTRTEAFLTTHGITQAEVAGALRLDPSAVSRKLLGVRPWRLDEVRALLRWLAGRLGRHVSFDEVFGAEDVEASGVASAGGEA